MPVLFKGGQSTPSSSTDVRAGSTIRPARPSVKLNQSSSADGRAASNTRPARPSAELDQSSSADGRAGSNTRLARPSAQLDQSSSGDGRAGSTTRPARPSAELNQSSSGVAELDRTRDQLGHPPSWTRSVRRMASWIKHATSSSNRQDGPVQFGGWPSWNDCAVFIPSSQLPPPLRD
ncbi:hypothetical protein F2Q68_00025507 [Brassica cretica]|uniref:Uncharacterized protein n=1 Tax=Brassica cretica TaxID=69181 RepID=A0A8S9I9R7_BRACR|nr:hypothetical protein F2Q68_00025507 [Brassica cretica]